MDMANDDLRQKLQENITMLHEANTKLKEEKEKNNQIHMASEDLKQKLQENITMLHEAITKLQEEKEKNNQIHMANEDLKQKLQENITMLHEAITKLQEEKEKNNQIHMANEDLKQKLQENITMLHEAITKLQQTVEKQQTLIEENESLKRSLTMANIDRKHWKKKLNDLKISWYEQQIYNSKAIDNLKKSQTKFKCFFNISDINIFMDDRKQAKQQYQDSKKESHLWTKSSKSVQELIDWYENTSLVGSEENSSENSLSLDDETIKSSPTGLAITMTRNDNTVKKRDQSNTTFVSPASNINTTKIGKRLTFKKKGDKNTVTNITAANVSITLK